MIWLEFSGWFQCRLATDPDPSDERRGVSGYVHAVAGEPDLDRVLRLQPAGTVLRSHCPEVGVTVKKVFASGEQIDNPIVGSVVELLGEPRFEGRNHILAEDGYEAIVPFNLRISKGTFILQRSFDDSMEFPPRTATDRAKFQTLQAGGVVISPGAIGASTGIFDLSKTWQKRIDQLRSDLQNTSDEIQRAAIVSRIRSMSDPRTARYFGARMMYSVPLSGTALVQDPQGHLRGVPLTAVDTPWTTDFWCGAWDPDALSGYMQGYLGIPIADPQPAANIARIMSDPLQERR